MTAADVQRVAAEYLTLAAATVVVVGHGAAFDAPLTALGAVDTLDTTIPTVPPGGTTVAGAADGGRAALDALADRLGGQAAFDALRTLRTTGETRAVVGGVEVPIGSTLAVRFPTAAQREALRLEQRLPMATVTVVLNGDAAWIVTPVGTQAAPPAVVAQVRAQQFLNLTVLLAHHAELAPERMPSAEGTVVAFRVPGVEAPYPLTLGPDGLPLSLASTQATPDGPAETVVRMDDWRETGGLRLPFRYAQSVGGEPAGTTQLSSVEVNPTLEGALFDAD